MGNRGIWRGKHDNIDSSEWIGGYLIKMWGKFCLQDPQCENRVYEIDPSTLGECTGLRDKNGKLIFKGDIIAYEDETPGQYEYHDSLFINRGIIKFCDGQFYFTNSIAATMDDLLNSGILDCEVIGNIHDNSELLKGEL